MGNYLSKELVQNEQQGDKSGVIEIIKKLYQAFLLAKQRLADMVYKIRDQRNDKLRKTPMAL